MSENEQKGKMEKFSLYFSIFKGFWNQLDGCNVDIRLRATVELIRLRANLALNDGETINHWLFHNHLGQGWPLNGVALKRMSTLE